MIATQEHPWLVLAIVGLVITGEVLGFLLRFLTIIVDWMDQR